jgi:hypothetical protein
MTWVDGSVLWIVDHPHPVPGGGNAGTLRRYQPDVGPFVTVRGDDPPNFDAPVVRDVSRVAARDGRLYVLERELSCAFVCTPRAARLLVGPDDTDMLTDDVMTVLVERSIEDPDYAALEADDMQIGPDAVYLLSDGSVYRVMLADGTVTQLPLASESFTMLAHGDSVFVSSRAGRIEEVTAGGPETVFDSGGAALRLLEATDGALYVDHDAPAVAPEVVVSDAGAFGADASAADGTAADANALGTSCPTLERLDRTTWAPEALLNLECQAHARDLIPVGDGLVVHIGTYFKNPPSAVASAGTLMALPQ